LYLEVPDASRYLEFYNVPFHYFDIEHINHFDEYSLSNLSALNCFEKIYIGPKEFQVSKYNLYPVVYGFFRKTNIEKPLVPNFQCRDKIMKYIKKSQKLNFFPEITNLAVSKKEIVVWGAGSYTSRLLKTTTLGKCNIMAFIDIDPNKQVICCWTKKFILR
jgi:hypothetical protein